jgi:hypothetical protein
MPDATRNPVGKMFEAETVNLSTSLRQKVALGVSPKAKSVRNEEQSRNVYENKQNVDILLPQIYGILPQMTGIIGHFGPNQHESSAICHEMRANESTLPGIVKPQ